MANSSKSAPLNQSPEISLEETIERCPHDKDHPYLMVARKFARDAAIDNEVRGFVLFCLSYPNDWKFKTSHLMKEMGLSKNVFARQRDKALEAGYMGRQTYLDSNNLTRYRYFVSEVPRYKNSNNSSDNPVSELPRFRAPENRGHTNNNLTENENTKELSPDHDQEECGNVQKEELKWKELLTMWPHEKDLIKFNFLSQAQINHVVSRYAWVAQKHMEEKCTKFELQSWQWISHQLSSFEEPPAPTPLVRQEPEEDTRFSRASVKENLQQYLKPSEVRDLEEFSTEHLHRFALHFQQAYEADSPVTIKTTPTRYLQYLLRQDLLPPMQELHRRGTNEQLSPDWKYLIQAWNAGMRAESWCSSYEVKASVVRFELLARNPLAADEGNVLDVPRSGDFQENLQWALNKSGWFRKAVESGRRELARRHADEERRAAQQAASTQ